MKNVTDVPAAFISINGAPGGAEMAEVSEAAKLDNSNNISNNNQNHHPKPNEVKVEMNFSHEANSLNFSAHRI